MSIKQALMDAMKDALRNKEQERLDTLRLMKGAILLIEKSGKGEADDNDCIGAFRAEVKKRQQTIELLEQHGKTDEAAATRREIAVIESFLPKQLSREDLVARVKAYLADHPGVDGAGKLTGAMKKELGDLADGKMLNEVCREALG